jgi:hypothetical protein
MPNINLLPLELFSSPGDYSVVGAADEIAALRTNDNGLSYVQTSIVPPLPIPIIEMSMDVLPGASSITQPTAVVFAAGAGLPGDTVRLWAELDGVVGAPAFNWEPAAGWSGIADVLPRPGGGLWTAGELRRATCLLQGGPNVTISYVYWGLTYVSAVGLVGIERAYLTARAGWQRAGASRSSFIPTATQGTTASAGLTPGSPGGYYSWRRRYLPQTVWTAVRPLAVDR